MIKKKGAREMERRSSGRRFSEEGDIRVQFDSTVAPGASALLCRFWSQLYLAGLSLFFFQADDGIRDATVTGVQTCALPISHRRRAGCPAVDRDRRAGGRCRG